MAEHVVEVEQTMWVPPGEKYNVIATMARWTCACGKRGPWRRVSEGGQLAASRGSQLHIAAAKRRSGSSASVEAGMSDNNFEVKP